MAAGAGCSAGDRGEEVVEAEPIGQGGAWTEQQARLPTSSLAIRAHPPQASPGLPRPEGLSKGLS